MLDKTSQAAQELTTLTIPVASMNSVKPLEVFEAIVTALEALVHTNPDATYAVIKAREKLTALSDPDTKPLPFGSRSVDV